MSTYHVYQVSRGNQWLCMLLFLYYITIPFYIFSFSFLISGTMYVFRFFLPHTFPMKGYLVVWDKQKIKLSRKTTLFGFKKMASGLMYCNSTKLCLSSEIIKLLSLLLGCCYSNLENQHDSVFNSHLYPQEVS